VRDGRGARKTGAAAMRGSRALAFSTGNAILNGSSAGASPMKRTLLPVGASLVLAACTDPVAPPIAPPRLDVAPAAQDVFTR
jgi:hypothetical protein